jgi:uncharacterized protein YjeT (DUF2065 family)
MVNPNDDPGNNLISGLVLVAFGIVMFVLPFFDRQIIVANLLSKATGTPIAFIGLGVIGIGIFLIFRSTKLPPSPTPETHVICPDCRKPVHRTSQQCEYCGCRLTPQ